MVGRDEETFLDFALREQGLLLFPALSDTPHPPPITSLADSMQNLFLAPRGRAKEIRYGKAPLHDDFVLDMASPAIKFSRAGVSAQRLLARGMLYLNTDIPRPHEVEFAYRHLEAWIRRHHRHAPADRVYAGPEAFAWLMKFGARPAR
jgi:hypothetical protein